MESKSTKKHKKESPETVKCAVITLSDSKHGDSLESKETDISGNLIIDALSREHEIVFYSIIPDESELLLSSIDHIIEKYDVDVIVTTGGTGIGSRDITIETLKTIFEKELDGFGEIFRYKSYKEIGAGAILSRATAGVYKRTLIISLPGSPNAVNLGLKLIIDELGHLVKHLGE